MQCIYNIHLHFPINYQYTQHILKILIERSISTRNMKGKKKQNLLK